MKNEMDLQVFLEMHFSNAEREASKRRFDDIQSKKEFIAKNLIEKRKDYKISSFVSLGMSIDQARKAAEALIDDEHIWEYFSDVKLDMETEKGWYIDHKYGLWLGYKKYLYEVKNIGKNNIYNIDKSTSRIVDKLHHHKKSKLQKVDDHGLVIGQIQSGKTTHMFGLIAKLIDSKFDVIVILTGIHEDLRAQTQSRLEYDLLGFSTKFKKYVGIGKMDISLAKKFSIKTTMDLDLKKSNAFYADFDQENKTAVYAVKKNKSVLESLNLIIEEANKSNKSIVVIDDESDFASINTKKDGVTVTNSEIRKALNEFKYSYYIAYTATPYANFFISKNDYDEQIGSELFPETFIEVLYPPKEYNGFESFVENDIYGNDLINFVDDRKNMDEEHIKNVVLDYIVSVALREKLKASRNLSPYATLLINDDIKIMHHKITQNMIEEELSNIATQFLFERSKIISKIDEILHKKISNIYTVKKEVISDFDAQKVIDIILSIDFFNRRKIYMLNSNGEKKATDIYNNINEYIIIIGGHKLSRGLTIEGLLVTSITRKVDNMADVLSQAARWCGYRNEYIDLMSIYTTYSNVQSYVDVMQINDELIDQIEYINESDSSPLDYRFSFMKPPRMKITNYSKMRSSITKVEHFANECVQTLKVDKTKINVNIELIESFVKSVSSSRIDKDNNLYFKNVSYRKILSFIKDYMTVNNKQSLYTYKTNPEYWAKYIRDANDYNELIDWAVVIKSNKTGDDEHKYKLCDFEINLPNLKVKNDPLKGLMSHKAVTLPRDEFLDHIIENGYEFDISDPRSLAREMRSRKNGLMIIYLTYNEGTKPIVSIAISFPKETSVSNETPSGKVYTT